MMMVKIQVQRMATPRATSTSRSFYGSRSSTPKDLNRNGSD